jgi:hypothetical protein
MCTKAKLTRIQQVIVFDVPFEYFWITFSNSLPVVDRRFIGCKFGGNFGSLPTNVIAFASLEDDRKCDNRKQWLNWCV